MTTKLYWDDAGVAKFTAQIVAIHDDSATVVLDRTAFYPLGGGQPSDGGTIGTARVKEAAIQDDGTILHHLAAPAAFTLGQEVNCQIDVARRLEMTQQHTGQHILSQAFFQLFGAETRGFRINPAASEIDLTLDAPADEIPRAIRQAEELANQIVFENRRIRTHLVTPEDAAQMPLRKENFIADCVRVVEIEEFDWSACGGTHAQQTGAVGLIAVKGWERAKKMTRVHFLCGRRVLADYRLANAAAETIARTFSVARDDAPNAVSRLVEESKQLTRRNHQLAEVAAKVEAESLLQTTANTNGLRVVTKIFSDRSFDELKVLAHQLVKSDAVVALLAVPEANLVRFVFARSSDVSAEMGTLMREACLRLGGKGGGTPDFAQGGGENIAELESTLTALAQRLG